MEDVPTCLVRLDYLAERVVADAGDGENIRHSLDKRDSSYNVGQDIDMEAEVLREESMEDLGLSKSFLIGLD